MGWVKDVWITLQEQVRRYPRWTLYLAAALVLLGAGFGCGYYRGAHVYGQPERAGRVEQQLDDVEKGQREITDGAERAAQRASDVQGRIEQGQEAISRADDRAAAAQESESIAADTIEKCERILTAIRERGNTN